MRKNKVALKQDTLHEPEQTASDPELWLETRNGDREAFKVLFFRHYEDLYKYAAKMCGNQQLAEDSIQDLFLKIWKCRSELREVNGVKTYLWKSLRNFILSKLRKKKRRLSILKAARDDIQPEVKLNVEELIVRQEMNKQNRKNLSEALDHLTSSQREALYLKFYQGMTYEEIEEVMSINYQTARNYVYKGIKSLKNSLD